MSATLDDAAIRRLADMHAVYRLFDEAGRLLYVGMSGRTGRRFDDHAVKAWWPLVRTVTLEWHDTAAQAALAERHAISAGRPRYNKAGLQPPKVAPRKSGLTDEGKRAIKDARQALIEERRAARERRRRGTGKNRQALTERGERLIREMPPRDLLADLDTVMGDERLRIRDVTGLLRGLAPAHYPYRKMTAVQLVAALKIMGVRVINSSGTPYLDPAHLRQARQTAA